MVFLGIVIGVAIVSFGLILLGHLSYISHKSIGEDDVYDPKMAAKDDLEMHAAKSAASHNDCPLSLLFFRLSAIANHETWIVASLLAGASVLLVTILVNG